MGRFFERMTSEWYGVAIICVFCVTLWLFMSVLLYKQFFKRFYDIFLSGFSIIILSPLLIALIIIGAISMKGNPFFTQIRPGKINKKTGKEKLFKMIKFRTMTCEKNENGEYLSDEKRLTKYGKLLRNTSLDELPELFNIFLGTMSIVGPRPQLIRDMAFMTPEIRQRHLVKGGLTGLAQVSGRNNISWAEKFNCDLQYVKTISFFGDFKILCKTVLIVFLRSNITRDGTVSDLDYGDWLLKEMAITDDEYNKTMDSLKD